MTNIEIDHKLAEIFGYKKVSDEEDGFNWSDDEGESVFSWSPSTYMGDAWEVAERFRLTVLQRVPGGWGVFIKGIAHFAAKESTAPLAICKAALKVIENQEGSKSDE